MIRRSLLAMAFVASVFAGGAAGVVLAPGVTLAQGNACTNQCRQQYGSCYIRTKNRDQCNAQLQACTAACPTPTPAPTRPPPPRR